MSEQNALNEHLLNGENLSPEALKTALTADPPAEGASRLYYAEWLLAHALETRDTEAIALLAGMMDADPALDEALTASLTHVLPDQPDAVYSFIRTHLNEHFDARWLSRLKMAALFSLRVAITDADGDTIINWLTLIAREPAAYELGDVLYNGILAAQPRTHDDPELARQLVLLAARRVPASLDILLADEKLLIALPDNLGHSLRDFDGDALLLLQNRGPEIFLIALARAARARAGAMFTPAGVTKIWDFYNGATAPALPADYRAETIVHEWLSHGASFLSRESAETLLTLMLTARRDELLPQLLRQPGAAETIIPAFILALERAGRKINEALDLIGRLLAADDLTPDQAAVMYINMLDGLKWSKDSLPLMQQLARTMQQYPALIVAPDALWHLLAAGAEMKDEFITKLAAKRLLATLESLEDETLLADSLKRLSASARWSEAAGGYIASWWRGFIRKQSINRLGRLDKGLEGKRGLESERDILHTLLALRKTLGSRSLSEYAGAVQAAYDVLAALAESFDPNPKRPVEFDADMLRAELEARDDQLSPEARQVLANNLKELAQIIGEMGDNRTKANLIRRSDDLDRDLMAGDQAPHSAVDALKWLAGYWGNTVNEEDSA